jgi:glycosyltransferase involved in cell wall biosynthesis
MKIALATPISLRSYGGAERKLVEAATILAEKGNEVSIYALPFAHSGRREDEEAISSSLKHPNLKYIEAKQCKIVADVAYVVYAPLIWRRFKLACPLVAGLHSPLLFASKSSLVTFTNPWLTMKRYKSLRYMGSFWLSALMKRTDLARFNAVRILNPSFKIRHRFVHCIPDWINSKVFEPRSRKGDVFVVFFGGRHHWEKGFDTFLQVAMILRKKGLKMRFMCTREGVGSVKGTGFLDDNRLASAYSSSHLVIYPSRMDTFGGVIVEAAACGTPVATTPLPAHRLGLPLLYADKAEEFVRATLRVYEMWKQNTGQYDKLAQTCRKQAMKYDIGNVFPEFEKMLAQVVAARQFSEYSEYGK